MLKSDLHPPHSGLNADPILYGVAAALADLFPPVDVAEGRPTGPGRDAESGRDAGAENRGED